MKVLMKKDIVLKRMLEVFRLNDLETEGMARPSLYPSLKADLVMHPPTSVAKLNEYANTGEAHDSEARWTELLISPQNRSWLEDRFSSYTL